MNGIIFIFSTSYQYFQQGKLLRSDVEKNATRNRIRENCGKVEADVELNLAYCGKLSCSAEFECIKSLGDTQSTQSARFESHSTKCRKPAAGGSNKQYHAASSSQVRLTNAKMNERARNLAAAGTNQDPCFQQRARKFASGSSDINDEDDSK